MAEDKTKLRLNDYNKPTACSRCGGRLRFIGVGEYRCENCGGMEYDDYGKVRNYMEKHPNRTQMQDIEAATGVPRRIIRQMLREERIQVAANSRVFLQCEVCRANIRSGRYCAKCAAQIRKQEEKPKMHHTLHGYGHGVKESEGAKRFTRER